MEHGSKIIEEEQEEEEEEEEEGRGKTTIEGEVPAKLRGVNSPLTHDEEGRLKLRILLRREFVVLLVLMALELLLAMAAVLYSSFREESDVENVKQLNSSGKTGGEEDTKDFETYVTANLLGSCGALFGSILSFMIILRPEGSNLTVRYTTVAGLKILTCCFHWVNIAFPTAPLLGIVAAAMALIGVELVVISLILFKASAFGLTRPPSYAFVRDSILGAVGDEGLSQTQLENIRQITKIIETRELRRRLHKIFEDGRRDIFWLCFFLFIITFAIIVFEFAKTVTTQDPLFSSNTLVSMKDSQRWSGYFNTTHRTHDSYRIIITVIDGLRYDYTWKNPDLMDFLNEPEFDRDARHYRATAQLPSMSVPNWVTILTGARPEFTGVLGNLLVPEVEFDHIFNQAKNYGLERGLTGSPWWANVIRSTLPHLGGDATVSPNAGRPRSDKRATADPADALRGEVAVEALQNPCIPYDLFLIHFSDVDIQGHCCGVTTRWNTHDTYNKAVSNKTALLREIWPLLDNNTVWVITSDHGHVDRGGHGGIHSDIMKIPLIFYKRGSALRDCVYTGPRFDKPLENMDIAPTVCALLGIPVPRQTLGMFVDDVMDLVPAGVRAKHYEDLFRQKQRLLREFRTSVSKGYDGRLSSSYLEGGTSAEFKSGVEDLMETLEHDRDETHRIYMLRNTLGTFGIAVIVFAGVLFMFQKQSFCDIRVVFSRARRAPRSSVGAMTVELDDITQECKRMNRLAFFIALLCVVTYVGLSLGIFLFLYEEYGYFPDIWDSTYIHTPAAVPVYILFCLFPGVVAVFVTIRGYNLLYSDIWASARNSTSRAMKTVKVILAVAVGFRVRYTNFAMIYVIRHYIILWTVCYMLFLFICGGIYSFIDPFILQIKFIDKDTWAYRFRVITLSFMLIPFVVGNLIMLFEGPPHAIGHPDYDGVYLMKITKDIRRRSPKTADQQVRVAPGTANTTRVAWGETATRIQELLVGTASLLCDANSDPRLKSMASQNVFVQNTSERRRWKGSYRREPTQPILGGGGAGDPSSVAI